MVYLELAQEGSPSGQEGTPEPAHYVKACYSFDFYSETKILRGVTEFNNPS
jgi:hypothetical protein